MNNNVQTLIHGKDEQGELLFEAGNAIAGLSLLSLLLVTVAGRTLHCCFTPLFKVLFSNGENDGMDGCAKINIRLHNYPESMIALKNLKAAYIDGKFSPPMKCVMHACKSRIFNPIRSSARPVDFQKIRIQELLKSEHHEGGRVPRTVECELTEDLVDACIPGDVVTVTGIIKMINNYMDIGGGKSKGKNQALFYLYLEAVSITNSKSQSLAEDLQDTNSNARAMELSDLFSFSARDLEFIVKFSEEYGSDIFRQMLQSICPSIYGHELVKGDPGLGKSQLLQAAASISPRGIYVCGDATTNAGLTVAVVKDPMTSDYWFANNPETGPQHVPESPRKLRGPTQGFQTAHIVKVTQQKLEVIIEKEDMRATGPNAPRFANEIANAEFIYWLL
ncbi:minichromosome maintenance 8 [Forsythia ovata]|uniref:Minichromosome maintenance 8 n=1 Tax=Forsythia ovata TaxID=205694 RepID=A0ABD1RLZ7_9LAMI